MSNYLKGYNDGLLTAVEFLKIKLLDGTEANIVRKKASDTLLESMKYLLTAKANEIQLKRNKTRKKKK